MSPVLLHAQTLILRTWLFAVLSVLSSSVRSQPQPPSFCFVLAGNADPPRPLERVTHVVQHYRERIAYVGINSTWLKPEEALVLQGGPLFRDSTEHWRVYGPREGMAASFVMIGAGEDTMRIDLPEHPQALSERAMTRWDRNTPEVIRFRKGRFAIEELIEDPLAVQAAKDLAIQLIAEDDAAYKRSLAELDAYYREHPTPPPVVKHEPPPPMTREEIEREIAARPGLKQVRLDRVSTDTLWVRITGRVMLNGGCASGMPLFGIEMLTDTGWVERIPFDLTQMDCGMPWDDWEDRVVMIPPLRWWVGVHQPEGRKELLRGTYRLFFVGADLRRMHAAEFELH